MPTVNLTHTFIEGCKSEAGRKLTEYRDSDTRGLDLRVSAKGKKTWRLHYTRRSDGKRRAVGLGTYPNTTLKDARTATFLAVLDLDFGRGTITSASSPSTRSTRS